MTAIVCHVQEGDVVSKPLPQEVKPVDAYHIAILCMEMENIPPRKPVLETDYDSLTAYAQFIACDEATQFITVEPSGAN